MQRILTIILLFIMLAACSAQAELKSLTPVDRYVIHVEFDTAAHRIDGNAEIITTRTYGSPFVGFLLNREFNVVPGKIRRGYGLRSMEEDKEKLDLRSFSPDYGTYGDWDRSNVTLWSCDNPYELGSPVESARRYYEVEFSGELYSPPDNRQFSRENIAFEVDGTIGTEGIYLSPSAWWYPRVPDSPAKHELHVKLPEGWSCVSDGKYDTYKDSSEQIVHRYISEQPTQGLTLSAGPFVVETIDNNGVEVQSFLLPAQADLADKYNRASKRYLSLYGKMLGDYPFPKFATVDNFLPSGYGMPGWTLLGSEVLRLPFIIYTSHGHEVLHNWFGNSLFVDYREGNWCEGLTVYLADYYYKEQESPDAAREYRMNVLRDYANYVDAESDYPVDSFVERSDAGDRSIGYGKVMMIFHMIRRMLDEQDSTLFMETLHRTYREHRWEAIGWQTWQEQFERSAGTPLTAFFQPWVHETGAPRVSLDKVSLKQSKSGWKAKLSIESASDGDPFNYLLPVKLNRADASVSWNQIPIDAKKEKITLTGDGKLSSITVDPDFDVFRHIYTNEMPVTFAAFFGDDDAVFVLPSSGNHLAEFEQVAEGLKDHNQQVVKDTEMTPELKEHSLWLFGGVDNALWGEYSPMTNTGADRIEIDGEIHDEGAITGTVIVAHPTREDKVIVATVALEGADPVGGTRKITHYGKYSYLVFDEDRNVQKGVWKAGGESPLVWNVRK